MGRGRCVSRYKMYTGVGRQTKRDARYGHLLKNHAQNTQINAYPVVTAASVNGSPIFMKSPNDTS